MFLHIGLNTALDVKDIVTVVNLINSPQINAKSDIIDVSGDNPKSMIICHDGTRETVYLSHITSLTLKRRFNEDKASFENRV